MSLGTMSFTMGKHVIALDVCGELFMPNQTTKLFSRAVGSINPGEVVFDIGSGVGPLALWAGLEPSREVHAVEVVDRQYDLLCANIGRNNLSHKVRAYRGPFFDPLPRDLKADVIIADVSGIAEGPARALGWYPSHVPTGGPDGTDVIIPLLQQAGARLREGGRMYFPIARGLSDDAKIRDVAQSLFGSVVEVEHPCFPFTPEQAEAVRNYASESPFIRLDTKGTRTVWHGFIYRASEPRFN